MNDSSCKTNETLSEWEVLNKEGVPEHIEKYGVSGIEEFFKTKLERWKNVEITIGVTGDSGVGKSSFINAIRGLKDDDEGAADTGVKETTIKVAKYPHPTNSKIMFWDLPGIGTPNYPTKTYSDKVGLEKYDTFLILTAGRFTENDLLLTKKVKSMKKSFFFVRAKIDQDVQNESRKRTFNEETTLNDLRGNCAENLKGLGADDKDVFLISNHNPGKWDFARLTQAILDVLLLRQRESLTLSINLLTSHSKDILKRKVEILRGRIWMVAAISAAGAVVPVPGLSIAADVTLITKEMNFYKSQLGLPEENSHEFKKMTPENQEIVRKFCVTSAIQIANLLAAYVSSSAVEEATRYIPFVGNAIAGTNSFSSTYCFLHECLKELEGTAMALLDTTSTRVVDNYVNQID